jgi:alpha-D-ribose 1-methylphosphonate 5-triphosphate diphosphatase PhnM
MRVSVDIPEQKSGLDSALAKQFADIQKQLMGLVKDQSVSKHEMHKMMTSSMASQQAMFVKSMEHLMGMVTKTFDSHEDDIKSTDTLVSSLQGIKKTMAELPGDLKDALDSQYQSIQKSMKVSVATPKVTVSMPNGLMNRIDSLESAMLQGMKRSRNRTFGSNY